MSEKKQAENSGAYPPGVKRRPGNIKPASASLVNGEPEKLPAEQRVLGWFGNNRWLLALVNFGAAVALVILGVWSYNENYGYGLPIGFALIGMRFLTVAVEVGFQLQTGQTGKNIRLIIPLLALASMVLGLTLKI